MPEKKNRKKVSQRPFSFFTYKINFWGRFDGYSAIFFSFFSVFCSFFTKQKKKMIPLGQKKEKNEKKEKKKCQESSKRQTKD